MLKSDWSNAGWRLHLAELEYEESSMRAALSILGLVIAFAVVISMMKKQTQALRPPASGVAASAPITSPDLVRQQLQVVAQQAAKAASEAMP